jgi:hypothetical protein
LGRIGLKLSISARILSINSITFFRQQYGVEVQEYWVEVQDYNKHVQKDLYGTSIEKYNDSII